MYKSLNVDYSHRPAVNETKDYSSVWATFTGFTVADTTDRQMVDIRHEDRQLLCYHSKAIVSEYQERIVQEYEQPLPVLKIFIDDFFNVQSIFSV